MASRKGGIIIIVSSAVIYAPMVGYAQYAPSKFALKGLCDCLRNELLVGGCSGWFGFCEYLHSDPPTTYAR